MFSGIVQQLATVHACTAHGQDQSVRFIYHKAVQPPLCIGDSISMNGVCLTATAVGTDAGKEYFDADISAETMRDTTLGGLDAVRVLNMECSTPLGAPLGGHLVSGHVDAVAAVRTLRRDGRSCQLGFGFDTKHRSVLRYIARKGSVAVDGVSLTVNQVHEDDFEVNVVPYTMEHTVFQHYKLGTEVNVEVDLMARYVARLLESGTSVS